MKGSPVYGGTHGQIQNQLDQEFAQRTLQQYYDKYGMSANQLMTGAMGGQLAEEVKGLMMQENNPQEYNRMQAQKAALPPTGMITNIGMPGSGGGMSSGISRFNPQQGTQVLTGGQRPSNMPGLFNNNPFS